MQYGWTLFIVAESAGYLLLSVAALLGSVLFFHWLAVTSPFGNNYGSWMEITAEAKRLADITSAAMRPQNSWTMMFSDMRTEALYVRESMASRYVVATAFPALAAGTPHRDVLFAPRQIPAGVHSGRHCCSHDVPSSPCVPGGSPHRRHCCSYSASGSRIGLLGPCHGTWHGAVRYACLCGGVWLWLWLRVA